MQDLNVTVIQSDLHWEDIGANLAMFEEKIWRIGSKTDAIVLPEMFSTGFTMNAPGLAEMMNMRTTKWMRQMADQTGALLIGSFICQVHNRYYNRLVWMEPGGNLKTYDKRHLFRMSGEQKSFASGESLLIGSWKGWRICPIVCYDLRFPVWCRNRFDITTRKLSYDLLICIANWPTARIVAWDTLLKARAIENLCYTVGVNRIGQDGNGIEHNGHSSINNPKGESIFTLEGIDTIKTMELNAHSLQAFRDKFPAYMDADDFSIDFEQFEETDFFRG
ncbi:MAG TPA: amidohydrolase [Cyclobacteriaceae bacterium]|jgi:predicted amidohydrolase